MTMAMKATRVAMRAMTTLTILMIMAHDHLVTMVALRRRLVGNDK